MWSQKSFCNCHLPLIYVGYTTDISLSIVTKYYTILMAHFITSDFEQKSHTWQKEYVLQFLSQWNMEKASGTSILVTTDSTSNMETAFASPNWKHIHCVTHTLDHYRSLQYSKCWHKVAKLFRSFTIGQIKAEREARGNSNSLVYPWSSQWWADRIQLWKSN